MVSLKEEIGIKVPFERLLDWVNGFEEKFVKWSPYHIECQLKDKSIAKGSRVRFYEIVMGLDYDVSGTIAESKMDKDGFRFVFLSD